MEGSSLHGETQQSSCMGFASLHLKGAKKRDKFLVFDDDDDDDAQICKARPK